MIVDELIAALMKFRKTAEVKVRVGGMMGPGHYTQGVIRNGHDEPVVVTTHKVDDAEDYGFDGEDDEDG